jgi:beta-lactamase superfamily II metal-dependent hydrolase
VVVVGGVRTEGSRVPKTMFVAANATQLVEDVNRKKKPKHALLWGDVVTDVVAARDAGHVLGTAHAHRGLVPAADLQSEPPKLLEVYVIDVGQGDAILIRTPDDRWHLVDGGPPGRESLLGEGARNFLAWKFGGELALAKVPLETVILSHSDLDHFGGLTEILRSEYPPHPKTHKNELVTTVEYFLHAGVAKYAGKVGLGVQNGRIAAADLLADHASFANPPHALAKEFKAFAQALGAVTTAAGGAPVVQRVTGADTVPGYAPAPGRPFSMRILGPVPETQAGDLKSLGDTAHTVNGHSVVVRLDYDKARILLTGDINAVAQRHLLKPNRAAEFRADVIKACHHGAEDIDADFTKAVAPRVTIVSSGDNEDYSHPRPSALGGYAYYGRRSFMTKSMARTKVQPPLLYATEIARSIKTKPVTVEGQAVSVGARPVKAIDKVIFGLVNIRTDGQKIVCAVRNELTDEFDAEELWLGADDQPLHDR